MRTPHLHELDFERLGKSPNLMKRTAQLDEEKEVPVWNHLIGEKQNGTFAFTTISSSQLTKKMAPHPRKKQKISKEEITHHDLDKDDEELELESMLFGKKKPSKKSKRTAATLDVESGGKEMGNLLDTDVGDS